MACVEVLKGVVLIYGDILGIDLKCEYICVCVVVEMRYCPVGDHFGFQVGFLKQYVV